ncbi:MAG: hypothetical protein RR290_00830 [Clostridia bacterium]
MKKGISLVALVATVVVMLILLTTVTISGVATVNNSKKMTLATELTLIKESVDAFITKSNGEYPINNSIQLDISNVTSKSKTQFDGENIVNNKIVLYEIDYKLLGLTSLKYGLRKDGINDVYVFSKDTKKVYYAKGVAVGSKTYYTLNDELKSMLDYKLPNNNVVSKDGVIFEPSEVNWTKNKVTVKVKIPKSYTSKSVTANGTSIIGNTVIGEYDIYDITTIDGNYSVVANYTKTGTSTITSSKYNVNNVDKVAPILKLDKTKQQLLESNNIEETYAYVKISEKSDTLSGIKNIKYENERINDADIETYFKTNGKTVYKDIITIEKNVKIITVYVEDKAGNWIADFVTVDDKIYSNLLNGPIVSTWSNPYIPKGFSKSTVAGETEVTTGFVIKDNNNENEFVWIPVADFSKFSRVEYNNGLTVAQCNEDKAQPELAAIYASVEKYGGYYIARYEAGLPDTTSPATLNHGKVCDGTIKPVSKPNVSPWNYIPWGANNDIASPGNGAVTVARSMYKTNADIQSTLIYGVQWDAALEFIKNYGIKDTIYPTDSSNKGNYTGSLKVTGASTGYKLNNIYDMAGNDLEWTMEENSTNRILRGAHYGGNGADHPAAGRYDTGITRIDAAYSFRPSLYIK